MKPARGWGSNRAGGPAGGPTTSPSGPASSAEVTQRGRAGHRRRRRQLSPDLRPGLRETQPDSRCRAPPAWGGRPPASVPERSTSCGHLPPPPPPHLASGQLGSRARAAPAWRLQPRALWDRIAAARSRRDRSPTLLLEAPQGPECGREGRREIGSPRGWAESGLPGAPPEARGVPPRSPPGYPPAIRKGFLPSESEGDLLGSGVRRWLGALPLLPPESAGREDSGAPGWGWLPGSDWPASAPCALPPAISAK